MRRFTKIVPGCLALAGLLNVSSTFAQTPLCISELGDTLSSKIVWQEDFGEFDLSDSTGKTYKVWDYSDLSNPVRVTKTTPTPFRHELENAPLGCEFEGKGPISDGEYTVAGLLTGYIQDYDGMTGAGLEWSADLHGVKLYPGFHYDHSGKPEGCCLFVNCKGNMAGQNIYERVIDGLCQEKQLSIEAYISIFTASAAGPYEPVDVTIKMSEVGNESNFVEDRGTQTVPEDGGSGTWVKISGSLFLEHGSAVKIEIINNKDIEQNGNDLVIDDIILRQCSTPAVEFGFEANPDGNTIDYPGSELLLCAYSGNSLQNYYGGKDNVYYLYQLTYTPEDKDSWINVKEPTKASKIMSGLTAINAIKTGKDVYFRVIAGDELLTAATNDDLNPNTPCQRYSISETKVISGGRIPSVLDGYNPVIIGDTLHCYYLYLNYRLSEKAPEGCTFSWYLDGENTGWDGDGYTNYSSDSPGEHVLSCYIVDPYSHDTVVVSHKYRAVAPGNIELSTDTIFEGIKCYATDKFEKYYWSVNDVDLSYSGAGPVEVVADSFSDGRVYVYAEDKYGCYTKRTYVNFDLKSTCGENSEKVIVWQEDFGEIRPDAIKEYTVWDYSDLKNPVKVDKVSTSEFCYELTEDAPSGYKFTSTTPIEDGEYTVAAALNGYLAVDCFCGDLSLYYMPGVSNIIKGMNDNLIIDHSGKMEGCALYVNVKRDTKNEVIYSRTISGLKKGYDYEAEVFFKSFQKNGSESKSVVRLKLRISEIGNPSNSHEISADASSSSPWRKISTNLNLAMGDKILVELINDSDYDKGGFIGLLLESGQLVIDDIRLTTCGVNPITSVETVATAENSADSIVNVYTVAGALVKANVKKSEALNGLANGAYVVGGEKVVVKK